jgi:hypothetical protein
VSSEQSCRFLVIFIDTPSLPIPFPIILQTSGDGVFESADGAFFPAVLGGAQFIEDGLLLLEFKPLAIVRPLVQPPRLSVPVIMLFLTYLLFFPTLIPLCFISGKCGRAYMEIRLQTDARQRLIQKGPIGY